MQQHTNHKYVNFVVFQTFSGMGDPATSKLINKRR